MVRIEYIVEAQCPCNDDGPERLGVVEHVHGIYIVAFDSRW